jgi:predicted PurR-regulated permease PerM
MLEGSATGAKFSYMSVAPGPIAALTQGVTTPRNSEIPKTWVIVLVIAAAALMAPFAGWVVLAVWLSGFARGLHERLTHRLHGRVQLAALLTVVMLMMVLVPVGIVVGMLVIDAIALVADLMQSDQVHSVLVSLVSEKNPNPDASVGELILMQGDRALDIVRMIVSSAAQIIIGFVILVAGMFAILVDGKSWYKWADDHAPIGSRALRRMGDAFNETGRGLAFGMVGAGLLQALAATAAYLVLPCRRRCHSACSRYCSPSCRSSVPRSCGRPLRSASR